MEDWKVVVCVLLLILAAARVVLMVSDAFLRAEAKRRSFSDKTADKTTDKKNNGPKAAA